MSDEEIGKQVKEVYARFGLAVYHAQVLEHGLVNALVILDLIPSRRHLARSRQEWATIVDQFMDRQFDATMGKMLASLRSVIAVPGDLENRLRDALTKRNWLSHGFFRDRAQEFMTFHGREQMLAEVDECRAIFESVDDQLEELVRPLRTASGITDEMVERSLREMTPPEEA